MWIGGRGGGRSDGVREKKVLRLDVTVDNVKLEESLKSLGCGDRIRIVQCQH